MTDPIKPTGPAGPPRSPRPGAPGAPRHSGSTPGELRENSGSSPRAGTPINPFFIGGVVVAGLVIGLAIVYFVLPRWLTTPDVPASTTTAAATGSADIRRLAAMLYYVGDDGASLVGVAREVAFGGTPAEQARSILSAQLAPPAADVVSAIPAGVQLRNVFLTPRGDAYVDLSREIISGHPGGSLNEALTVYTLVNALTQNIKEITGVQILVDGKQIDTLAGHIDLRQPLAASSRWVQKGQ